MNLLWYAYWVGKGPVVQHLHQYEGIKKEIWGTSMNPMGQEGRRMEKFTVSRAVREV